MAKTITERTLAGYNKTKMNVVYIEDLINKLRQEGAYKSYNLGNELTEKFRRGDKDMKFTAIVGNPPYQESTDDNNRDKPVYHLFMDEAYRLSERVSLISPARFLFNVGQTPAAWNDRMLSDNHLKVVYYEQKSSKVFPNTDIKGGVAITLRDETQDFGAIGVFIPDNKLRAISDKALLVDFSSLNTVLFGRSSYKLNLLKTVLAISESLVDKITKELRNGLRKSMFQSTTTLINGKYSLLNQMERES